MAFEELRPKLSKVLLYLFDYGELLHEFKLQDGVELAHSVVLDLSVDLFVHDFDHFVHDSFFSQHAVPKLLVLGVFYDFDEEFEGLDVWLGLQLMQVGLEDLLVEIKVLGKDGNYFAEVDMIVNFDEGIELGEEFLGHFLVEIREEIDELVELLLLFLDEVISDVVFLLIRGHVVLEDLLQPLVRTLLSGGLFNELIPRKFVPMLFLGVLLVVEEVDQIAEVLLFELLRQVESKLV